MESLVGFGRPWAIAAPMLASIGYSELKAVQTAALANNAPVSHGALRTPIITLAAATGLPLLLVSATVGRMVAISALFAPLFCCS